DWLGRRTPGRPEEASRLSPLTSARRKAPEKACKAGYLSPSSRPYQTDSCPKLIAGNRRLGSRPVRTLGWASRVAREVARGSNRRRARDRELGLVSGKASRRGRR